MSVPLVPRRHLFGNPVRAQARVSPDGRWISFLAPREGVLNVWVAPIDDPLTALPITADSGRGIRVHAWAEDALHVLYQQDRGGDENWRVYAVDVRTGVERDLTPFEGVQARIVAASPDHPGEVLLALNDRDPTLHDLHRVEVATGRSVLVERNDAGFADYVADWTLQPRIALRQTEDGGFDVFRKASDTWKVAFHVAKEDALGTGPLFVDESRDIVWMQDSRGRDTAALVRWDLTSGEFTLVGASDRADFAGILVHPRTREVEAWADNWDRVAWHVLDERVAADLARLREAGGDVEVVSRDRADRYWVVAWNRDDAPMTYGLLDRSTGDLSTLFSTRPDLGGAPLVPLHPVRIPARDGLDLVSYLSLPSDADPARAGRPVRPLPLVLSVHGGPWARDGFGFNGWHQWLANRGYAVLSVNFRGSLGFGKRFVGAGDHEWGRRMHDDLLDAVEWAVAEGIAQRDRVAISGGSYGGYATLVGLAFTPGVFACGVDIVGPSNLETLLATIPPYWKPLFETFAQRVGDPRTEAGQALLRERSPLHRADRIRRPLLIAQGANDPRVKEAESDQIVAAMRANGLPVTYVRFPDEGHGFARPQNNLAFSAITEAFLAGVLGGRTEPFGSDLDGSSLEVPVGVEHIPGLAGALGG